MIYFLDLHENHGCAIRLAITPSRWGSMFAHAPAGLYLYTPLRLGLSIRRTHDVLYVYIKAPSAPLQFYPISPSLRASSSPTHIRHPCAKLRLSIVTPDDSYSSFLLSVCLPKSCDRFSEIQWRGVISQKNSKCERQYKYTLSKH